MLFFTDQAVEQLPALAAADLETRQQAFADADVVYAYLRRSEGQRDGGVPEAALRKWGEQNDIGPDRMNAAIEVLRAADRVMSLA